MKLCSGIINSSLKLQSVENHDTKNDKDVASATFATLVNSTLNLKHVLARISHVHWLNKHHDFKFYLYNFQIFEFIGLNAMQLTLKFRWIIYNLQAYLYDFTIPLHNLLVHELLLEIFMRSLRMHRASIYIYYFISQVCRIDKLMN